MDAAELTPGDRVGGRFEVIRSLGSGGFGSVYLARDLDLGRRVAIKVVGLGRSKPVSAADLKLFDREAKATARLNHAHIVTVYDWGTWSGFPYLVLEWLQGETLAQRVARGPLPVREALAVTRQLLGALRHAHEAGVLHLDLKPANVFVCEDARVKILDLGLARLDAAREGRRLALGLPEATDGAGESLSITGGTPSHMAPEQWRGEEPDARTDVWAVGVTLFEMLSGTLPFEAPVDASFVAGDEPAPSVGGRVAGVPLALDEIVATALRKRPDDRFPSAAAMLEAVETFARSLEGPVPETEHPYRYLEPFTEDDAPFFFGRGRETTMVRGMLSTRPLVALLGPSGAGKSSLVLAGLIPGLRRESHPWTVITMRPGSDPVALLAERLTQHCGAPPDLSLVERPGLAGETLRDHAARTGGKVLLFVDQLEELYSLNASAEARRAFSAALLSAADDAGAPTRVVVAMREDFLSRMADSAELRGRIVGNGVYLDRPDTEAMLDAVRGPARALGFELEPGLAEDMVRGLPGEPVPLPLLQLATSRLWEDRDRERRILTRSVLSRMGGMGGVLAVHANEVLERLPDDRDQALAQAILTRLVTPAGTRARLDRRDLLASFPDPEAAGRVLEHLLRGRLLTGTRRAGKTQVELAHESLGQRWERLRDWLDESQLQRRFLERVTQAAALWEERGQPPELVWRGDTYDEASRWRSSYAGPLGRTEAAFLDAAETIARRMRRARRRLLVLGAVVAVAAVGGSLVAIRFYREAARTARAQSIVHAADAATDPHTAALLLLELPADHEPAGAASIAYRVLGSVRPLAILRGPQGRTVVAVSPKGTHVATASTDGRVRVFPILGGTPVVLHHRAELQGVAFGPRGERVLSWSRAEAWIWRADGTGEPVVLKGHNTIIWHAAFSPDGLHVVTGSYDRTARVWRADGRGKPVVLSGHRSPIMHVSFSPEGKRVVTATSGGTARIWRWASPTTAPVILRGHEKAIWVAEFSPDGTLVATASIDGTARIWRVDGSGPPLILRHKRAVRTVAFSPDGTRVVTACDDGTARIWRADGTGEPLPLVGHQSTVTWAAFDPSGSRVVTSSTDKTARIWRADGTGAPIVLRGHEVPVWKAFFAGQANKVVTSADGAPRIWPAKRSREPRLVQTRGQIRGITFGPAQHQLVAFHLDGSVSLFQGNGDGSARARVLRGHRGPVMTAAFDPSGRRLVTGSLDFTASVWDLPRGVRSRVLRGHTGAVFHAEFNRDGSRILTASADRTARLWSSRSGKSQIVLKHPERIRAATFSPGGEQVATAAVDGAVRLWRTGAHRPPIVLRGSRGALHSLAYSPDGTRIAAAGKDRVVRVWRTHAVGEPTELGRHQGSVLKVAFTPDGSQVVSTSADGTARIWPASTAGGDGIVLRGHLGAVRSLEVTPDGSTLVTCAPADGTARIWRQRRPSESIVLAGHETLVGIALSRDGSRVAAASHEGAIRIWRLRAWPQLLEALSATTRGCLSAADRRRLLDETRSESLDHRASCLRRRRRAGRLLQPSTRGSPLGGEKGREDEF